MRNATKKEEKIYTLEEILQDISSCLIDTAPQNNDEKLLEDFELLLEVEQEKDKLKENKS
jgi:hypothetical protein